MTDFSNALDIAASGMRSQAQRLRHVSENIANSDTPGYRRKTVSFTQDMTSLDATGAVKVDRVELDRSELIRHFDPSHPMADANGYYSGSNVNMLVEIADAREAQRSYEANLKIFEQTRRMSSALLDLLRR